MAGRLSSQSNTNAQSGGRLSSTLPPLAPRKTGQAKKALNAVGGVLGVRNYGESLGQTIAQPFVRKQIAKADAVSGGQTEQIIQRIRAGENPQKFKRALQLIQDTERVHRPAIQEITPVLKKSNQQLVGEAISAGTAIGGGFLGASKLAQAPKAIKSVGLLKGIAPLVSTGAVSGGFTGLGSGLERKDATLGSVAKSVAVNTALGAGLGAGLGVAGNAVSKGLGRLASKIPTEQIDNFADDIVPNAPRTDTPNVSVQDMPNVPTQEAPVLGKGRLNKKVSKASMVEEYNNLNPKDYGPNDYDVLEHKNKVSKLEEDLGNLETYRAIEEDRLNNSPYKSLAKYANKNGEIPEVGLTVNKKTGKVSGGKFARQGDSLATEYGFNDTEELRNGYSKYKEELQNLKEQKLTISEMKKEYRALKKNPPILAKPTQTVTGQTVTKASKDLNRHLVEKGFDDIPFEEQAKYTSTTKQEQIDKISDLMGRDIESAKLMATGKIPMEGGVLPQPLFNAIERHAIENGDIDLIRSLAKSPVATQLSEAGQTLGSHGFNDNPNSAVDAIKKINKFKEERALAKLGGKSIKQAKSEIVGQIKNEIKKSAQKQDWAGFLDSITC